MFILKIRGFSYSLLTEWSCFLAYQETEELSHFLK